MSKPTKQVLLSTVVQLQGVIQEMFAAYANDVAPNRAERMEALMREGEHLAQTVIDAFPYDYLEAAMKARERGE